MLGIRNPVTHEFNWVEDSEVALELLVFAQHLLRKAKLAKLSTPLSLTTSKLGVQKDYGNKQRQSRSSAVVCFHAKRRARHEVLLGS